MEPTPPPVTVVAPVVPAAPTATQAPLNLYPDIKISRPEKPNRLFAIPLMGFIVKVILIIPVGLEILALGIAVVFAIIANSFIVLFTGRYNKSVYDLNMGLIRLATKMNFYLYGLTDKYPGFSLQNAPDYTVEVPYPENPNRLFAIPFLGGLARIILLIPFTIYSQVINNTGYVAALVSFAPVLFKKYYPESTFEIARDSVRVNQAMSSYIFGLSDRYPSFWISMNHKTIKIILIVVGVIFTLLNFSSSSNQ